MTATPPRPRHPLNAALYDLIDGAGSSRLRPLRRFAAGGASGRVLEIGAGTGANLPFYDWDRVQALELCEPDPHMLRRAARRLAALDTRARARVSVHAAPAEALPFEAASFDCVVSTLVLCSVADQAQALAEALRVLEPGGELRLVEHVLGQGTEAKIQRLVQPVYGLFAAGCHLDRDTEAAVRRAGFALTVETKPYLAPLNPAFAGVATRPY
jgi:ubiquinone/menaquinone biosynthesis C-methylase UbiE